MDDEMSFSSTQLNVDTIKKFLPHKKTPDARYFSLPDNFEPGSIAFANFPVHPNMRKVKPITKRLQQSGWNHDEAKRIYVKKTMNLYHWTQPGLPTDYVRKLISDSWDNMSEEEKQIYVKQANGENGPLMVHPHLSLMYQCGQLGEFARRSKSE